MDKYVIKINGQYLKGYDETKSVGKVGHDGWQPRAQEMEELVLTLDKGKARVMEGVMNLRSDIEKILNRMRYADLKVNKLEVVKVVNDE